MLGRREHSRPFGITLAIRLLRRSSNIGFQIINGALSRALRRIDQGDSIMKIENPTALLAALKPVDMPIGLVHFDSDFCWCDPTIEVDDYGRDIIVHRQVTWN